jgi:hypothetical protein
MVPGHSSQSLSDGQPEYRARKKVSVLWRAGSLFHVTTRYPRKRHAPRIDRLAGILRNGLIAPGRCQDGSVCSDLHLTVTGTCVPYDSLVFLHRFGRLSPIYTIAEPGRFAVFVDPDFPVLTPEAMGSDWVELCQDEVYAPDGIGLEHFRGIAVYPGDADSVLREWLADFRRLELPLYDYDGNVLWPYPHSFTAARDTGDLASQ